MECHARGLRATRPVIGRKVELAQIADAHAAGAREIVVPIRTVLGPAHTICLCGPERAA